MKLVFVLSYLSYYFFTLVSLMFFIGDAAPSNCHFPLSEMLLLLIVSFHFVGHFIFSIQYFTTILNTCTAKN